MKKNPKAELRELTRMRIQNLERFLVKCRQEVEYLMVCADSYFCRKYYKKFIKQDDQLEQLDWMQSLVLNPFNIENSLKKIKSLKKLIH